MKGAMPSGEDPPPLSLSRNPRPAPVGFQEFWTQTLAALLSISPEVESVTHDHPPGKKAVLAEMTSFGGAKVRVWFSGLRRSSAARPTRPLLVTAHGYGGHMEPERVRRLLGFGFDVVGLDVRGFGQSAQAVGTTSPYGYLITGCESKESSILRGAVCDYLQAYRAALEWFGQPRRVTFQGFSFSGGLCLMATGVLSMGQRMKGAPPLPDVVAAGAPTFGYLDKRLEKCEAGSGKELYRYLKERPHEADAIKETFRYFDTSYFAPYLSTEPGGVDGARNERRVGRIIFGVGTRDPIVPAETVYAIKNALPVDPELHVMPFSHTERPEEAEWVRWEGAWIRAGRSS